MQNMYLFLIALTIYATLVILIEVRRSSDRREIPWDADLSVIRTNIECMSPRTFELFCGKLYKALGYKVKVTQETGDGGKDVIAWKDGIKIFIECKHFAENHAVGRPIAQKLIGAMAYEKADKGIIFTTGTFTQECTIYCEAMNIDMVDLNDIMEMIKYMRFKRIPFIAA